MHSETASSRSTTNQSMMSNSSDDLNFDLPQHYKPLRIGILSRKTKLEEILEHLNLPHEDYIWYTEVLKVQTYLVNFLNSNQEKHVMISHTLFYQQLTLSLLLDNQIIKRNLTLIRMQNLSEIGSHHRLNTDLSSDFIEKMVI